MSKYDFPLDLSENTSTGKILKKIPKGCTVLEFGCAEGRMTKYMKEKLNCRVYIVEFDKEAFDKAIHYAEDGICDDILNYTWEKRFNNISFDVILFVDVLEHLTKPAEVLKMAGKLLNPSGKVYVSIPNISHNDILLNLYHDSWNYTACGLLDNTHIHFWGYENIKPLAHDAALHLASIEATYCPIGMTEQRPNISNNDDIGFRKYLLERRYGEVYQFILTMDHDSSALTEENLKKTTLSSHIYYDLGTGFTKDQVVAVNAECKGRHTFVIDFICKIESTCQRLRLDPVEGYLCKIDTFKALQDDHECKTTYKDAIYHDGKVFMLTDDSQIVIDLSKSQDNLPVNIHAEFSLIQLEDVKAILNICKDFSKVLLNDNKIKQNKPINIEDFQNIIAADIELRVQLKHQLEKVNDQISELQTKNQSLTKRNELILREAANSNQRLLADINILKTQAESLQAEKQAHLSELDIYVKTVAAKDEILIENEQRIQQLENSIRYYRHLPGVRIGRAIKRMLRKFKMVK